MIISPIFYMGNKKKLIQKGLIDLFPNDIDCFIDVFAGSSVVSMNVKANQYYINDNDKNLKLEKFKEICITYSLASFMTNNFIKVFQELKSK